MRSSTHSNTTSRNVTQLRSNAVNHPTRSTSMSLKTKTLLPSGLALLASGAACLGQSAWLPDPEQIKATPGFSFSTFDKFWAGDKRVPNPPNGDSLNQYSG